MSDGVKGRKEGDGCLGEVEQTGSAASGKMRLALTNEAGEFPTLYIEEGATDAKLGRRSPDEISTEPSSHRDHNQD